MRWCILIILVGMLTAGLTVRAGVIQTRDGKIYHGTIKFCADGKITITQGATTTLAPADVVHLLMADPPPRRIHGLLGEYFQGADFTNPKGQRVDPVIDVRWPPGTEVIPGITNDVYAVRWTGQIQPLYNEQYTISTVNDDDVRVWIDNKKVAESWTGSQGTASGTINLLAGKRYDIQIDFVNRQLDGVLRLSWSSRSQPEEIVPARCLFANVADNPNAGTGLRAEYFANSDMQDLRMTRLDAQINFHGRTLPDMIIKGGKERYAVRWSGYLQPRYSGTYTLATHSNGGVHLKVAGQLLIDDWQRKVPQDHSATVLLHAGQKVPLTMEYGYGGYNATVELFWSSDKQQREVVPQECLFAEEKPAATVPPNEFASEAPLPPQGIILTDGTVLPAVPDELQARQTVKLRWGTHDLALPAEHIAVVFYDSQVLDPGRTWPADNGVLMRHGDFLEGSILAFKHRNVKLSSILFGIKNEGADTLRAVLFTKPAPARTPVTVCTTDGSVFPAGTLTSAADSVTITTENLGTLTLLAGDIFSIKTNP